MSTKTQRYGRLKKINFNGDAITTLDAVIYEPTGAKFNISILKALDEFEPFADLKNEPFEVRGLLTQAPDLCPLDQAYRQRVEFDGVIYTAYVLLFTPILPVVNGEEKSVPQLVGLLLDESGRVVFKDRVQYGGHAYQLDFSGAVRNTVNAYLFQRDSKKVPASGISTTIETINAEALTHHFTANVNAPGFGNYQHRGEVADLKKRGILPGKQDFFKEAFTWSPFGRTALIAQDSSGMYHISVLENGKPKAAQKQANFQGALSNAIEQTI
jgi:hypothetical protein